MDLKRHLILQKAALTEAGRRRLSGMFSVIGEDDYESLREQIEAVVTTGGVPVTEELIEQLPNLKVIATRGVGFEHIDSEAAFRRGIAVSHTPGVLTDCVADLAMGALIAVSRRLLVADHFVRNRQWLHKKFPLTTKVSGKRLGIVGMGRIGQAVARRARVFDMEISYFSRTEKTDCPDEYQPSLDKLAEWADFLLVCAPGGESTRHLISAAILDALGAEGFLVNVARGSLVDETALVRALQQKRIAGAALDVFDREPEVPEQLLWIDQVVLLPHIGSSTRETFKAMEDLLIDNLRSFFSREGLLTPVAGK